MSRTNPKQVRQTKTRIKQAQHNHLKRWHEITLENGEEKKRGGRLIGRGASSLVFNFHLANVFLTFTEPIINPWEF